jgi:hypothetical protein
MLQRHCSLKFGYYSLGNYITSGCLNRCHFFLCYPTLPSSYPWIPVKTASSVGGPPTQNQAVEKYSSDQSIIFDQTPLSGCNIKDAIALEGIHQGAAMAAMVKVITLVLDNFVCGENEAQKSSPQKTKVSALPWPWQGRFR